jgi:hypothetical protein
VLPDWVRGNERLPYVVNVRVLGAVQKPVCGAESVAKTFEHDDAIDPVEQARRAIVGAKTGRDPLGSDVIGPDT